MTDSSYANDDIYLGQRKSSQFSVKPYSPFPVGICVIDLKFSEDS